MEVIEEKEAVVRTANDWINEAKQRPIPKALFGEYWREGETALLFGDTGKGTSSLAMQIGQSIASGKGIKPFKAATKPQKVLYLDLEMNDKQFETRYAADHDGGRAKFLRKHFEFSDNLFREELDPADMWVPGEKTCDVFRRTVRRLVKESGASVVIIDNLSCLKRSYYGSREILDLMTTLKKLQKEMNISILALVQTPRHDDSQALTANSLRGMKLLCGRADSVFGIGQNRFYIDERYIKRVKARGDVIDFDALHVPTFRLKKLGGNFLGFEFRGFMPEIELISDVRASREWKNIEKIKQMNDGGMSIRAIADKIDLPKTTVHRLLQMWRPPLQKNEATAAAVVVPKTSEPSPSADLSHVNANVQYDVRSDELDSGRIEPPATAGGTDKSYADKSHAILQQHERLLGGLKRSYDHNDQEIFVEKEDDRGKPVRWYKYDQKGRLYQWIRDSWGSVSKQIDGPPPVL